MIKHTLSLCAAILGSAGASRVMHRLTISLIAITLSGTAVAQTAAASPLKPPPVASDCSVDVTDAFNSWLATVPNGSTINLARRGCYVSNGSIVFKNKRNITIRGHGAIIRASGEPACPGTPPGTRWARVSAAARSDRPARCKVRPRSAWMRARSPSASSGAAASAASRRASARSHCPRRRCTLPALCSIAARAAGAQKAADRDLPGLRVPRRRARVASAGWC